MPQLVGSDCRICGERIASVDTGRLCSDCRSPIHTRCGGPTLAEKVCPTCGADIRGQSADGFEVAQTRIVPGGSSEGWLSFHGRASRGQYFTHSIVSVMLVGAMTLAIGAAAEVPGNLGPFIILAALGILLVIGPWCEAAATVKRLHDLDRPGWHFLLALVPIYNIYLTFVLLLQPGTIGENRFGPDPLTADETEGDRLLSIGNRFEMNGDWQQAFEAYKGASEELKGQQNEDYAIECIKRLHEKVMLDQPAGR